MILCILRGCLLFNISRCRQMPQQIFGQFIRNIQKCIQRHMEIGLRGCWCVRACEDSLPERSCLIRPLLLLISTGRKSLNQEISGSGFPLAAHSMVAVRVLSTTFSWGPMSMVGKP